MQSTASTPEEYIAELPTERREPITVLRKLLLKHLPKGYQEGMLYGMLVYYIPLTTFSDTYNKQPLTVVGLASQKNHCSLYVMTAYGDNRIEKMLKDGFAQAGKKLNMGKSCIRFTSLDQLSLPTLVKVFEAVSVDEYIQFYKATRSIRKK